MKVEAESGRPLPPPGLPWVEYPRAGKPIEATSPRYDQRSIMLSVANFFQTVGFYGFADWIPTLPLTKGITVAKTLVYTLINAFMYPLCPLVTAKLADMIERKWQVCLSCRGIAAFGIAFSTQTGEVPLIIIGAFQTMMNAWLSYSSHNYQAELFPTRMRASAVGFCYSWSRLSAIFTGFVISWLLGLYDVPAVFAFIAGAMGMVIMSVTFWGLRTNMLALEEISH